MIRLTIATRLARHYDLLRSQLLRGGDDGIKSPMATSVGLQLRLRQQSDLLVGEEGSCSCYCDKVRLFLLRCYSALVSLFGLDVRRIRRWTWNVMESARATGMVRTWLGVSCPARTPVGRWPSSCTLRNKPDNAFLYAGIRRLEAIAYYEEPIPDANPVASLTSTATSPLVALASLAEELFPNTAKEAISRKATGKDKHLAVTNYLTTALLLFAKRKALNMLIKAYLFDSLLTYSSYKISMCLSNRLRLVVENTSCIIQKISAISLVILSLITLFWCSTLNTSWYNRLY
jgi:hypothetical protein